MSAPFFKFGLFGDEASLIVAFLIGTSFGFFLERAGFGSARKLVAQFYLTDLAVFKVMFTAIVTAMLGVTYLAWMGVLDLSLVYLVPTYWAAQVVGGLLLGVGFVVGGYCPGTSVAAVATGKIDEGRIIRNFFARTKQPLLQEWLIEMAMRIGRRLPVRLGFLMGLSAVFRPRTRGWGKARDAIAEYVHEQETQQRQALGLKDK